MPSPSSARKTRRPSPATRGRTQANRRAEAAAEKQMRDYSPSKEMARIRAEVEKSQKMWAARIKEYEAAQGRTGGRRTRRTRRHH